MNNNPFVLPGFGQSGPMGQNPILASMEMMRQAWEGLASSGNMDASAMGRMMSVEEMDKRIADLRAVENWLRMNLSMLTSTIQGLEIQRSTLSTLQTFAQSGMSAMPGLAEFMAQTTAQSAAQPTEAKPEKDSAKSATAEQSESPAEQLNETAEGIAQAGQAWWGLMQQQFDALAQATTQSVQQAQSVAENLSATVANPSADTTFGKKTSTKATSAAKKSSAKKASAKKATKATKKVAKKATKAAKKAVKKTTSPT